MEWDEYVRGVELAADEAVDGGASAQDVATMIRGAFADEAAAGRVVPPGELERLVLRAHTREVGLHGPEKRRLFEQAYRAIEMGVAPDRVKDVMNLAESEASEWSTYAWLRATKSRTTPPVPPGATWTFHSCDRTDGVVTLYARCSDGTYAAQHWKEDVFQGGFGLCDPPKGSLP